MPPLYLYRINNFKGLPDMLSRLDEAPTIAMFRGLKRRSKSTLNDTYISPSAQSKTPSIMTDNIVSHAINSVEATRVFKTEKLIDLVSCFVLMSQKVGVKDGKDRVP